MAKETIQEFKDILLRMENKIDELKRDVLTNQYDINEIKKDLYINNGNTCLFTRVSNTEDKIEEQGKIISNFKAVCYVIGFLFTAAISVLGIMKK